MRLSSLPGWLLLCSTLWLLGQSQADAQYRSLTPEEERDLCAATRPHYEKPLFDPSAQGLKIHINTNPYRWSPLEKREVIGFDFFRYSNPDSKMACLSNSVWASGWGRITDPRGTRVCGIDVKWEGRHVSSQHRDGTLEFRPGKPLSYKIHNFTCRWQ